MRGCSRHRALCQRSVTSVHDTMCTLGSTGTAGPPAPWAPPAPRPLTVVSDLHPVQLVQLRVRLAE